MIEVIFTLTGDRAECESPEAALTAARTLGRDAVEHGVAGAVTSGDLFYFVVDGVLVKQVRWGDLRT